MISGQSIYRRVLKAPGTAATNATADSLVLDTAGGNYWRILAVMNPASAATAAAQLHTLILQEGDTTVVGDHTSVVVGTTTTTSTAATNFVLAEHGNTTDSQITILEGSCGGTRKRYLSVQFQAEAAANDDVCIIGEVIRLNQSADTLTETGSSGHYFVGETAVLHKLS